jgi:hypothetical protein
MGPTVSSTNKTDRYDITEILLNIKQTNISTTTAPSPLKIGSLTMKCLK